MRKPIRTNVRFTEENSTEKSSQKSKTLNNRKFKIIKDKYEKINSSKNLTR